MSNAASRYSAQKVTVDAIEVVRLTDSEKNTVLSVVPSIGNNAYSLQVNGKDVFFSLSVRRTTSIASTVTFCAL